MCTGLFMLCPDLAAASAAARPVVALAGDVEELIYIPYQKPELALCPTKSQSQAQPPASPSGGVACYICGEGENISL